MEWDAGAFMKIAIGIFFLVFAGGMGYALFRLAGTLAQVTYSIRDVVAETVPILSRFQTTVDEVNSELSKVDEITGTVVAVTERLERTTAALQGALGTPVKKLAGFSAGVGEGLSNLLSSRRKEE